jgi:hypothetical protein
MQKDCAFQTETKNLVVAHIGVRHLGASTEIDGKLLEQAVPRRSYIDMTPSAPREVNVTVLFGLTVRLDLRVGRSLPGLGHRGWSVSCSRQHSNLVSQPAR